MRTALVAILLSLATPVLAAPRHTTPAVASASSAAASARAELTAAKAKAKVANHRLKLAKARAAAAKSAARLQREQWIADCMAERSAGGEAEGEAIAACEADVPDSADSADLQ